MKTPSAFKPSLTLLDGTTYQKEFPVWVASTSEKIPPRETKNQNTSAKQNVYYESLKPLFIILTLAGILPVFKLRLGNHKLQALVVGSFCLAVYFVFAYFTYLVTMNTVYLIFHDEDFSSIIVQVTLMMLLMQHVFYLVLTWPESLAVNKYLVEWKNFQSQYEAVTGSKLGLNCRAKLMLAVCAAFLISAAYPFCVNMIDSKSNPISNYTEYTVVFYHLFIQLCFYILWFSNSWAVAQAAEQYNERLSQECMLDITAEKLEEYRLVWMRLTEIVHSGSSMLSYTMALMVTTPFAYEVIASYNLTMFVISSIQHGGAGETSEAVATLFTFIFYGTLLYMFCNSGHCMTTKCEKVQDVLLTHKPRLPSALAKVNSELRLFLRCMRSVPPHATLSGYVVVNRKVFLHMTGVLVTYLIILVQFNIGSINTPGPAPAPASTTNSTHRTDL